jgi:uncharacterized protein YwgA
MTILTPEKVGNVKEIEKLKNILVYLVAHIDETKYKTELIKLSFILDYRYSKMNKSNATSVEYVKYNYGPYSDSFIEALDQLKNEGILAEISLPFGAGFTLVKEITDYKIDDNLRVFIDQVIVDYGKRPLREMKAFIYNLEEFKRTDFGKPIVINQ